MRVTRRSRLAISVILVAVEFVVTVAGTWVYLAANGRVVAAGDVPPGATALVLGSLVVDGAPGDYVRGRLDTTIDLYRRGGLDRILVSGNGRADAGAETAVMRSYLTAHGVPDEVIVEDPEGYDTDRSCRNVRDVFGIRAVVVVTQDFHLGRAIALCRLRGVDATGVAAGCPCPVWSMVRNHVREALLARPRALLTAVLA